MAIPAGELPDPKLKAGVENVPTQGQDAWSLTRDFMTMSKIGLMQEFPGGEKRRLKTIRVERDAERGTAVIEATTLSIERDAATAWVTQRFAGATEQTISAQLAEAGLNAATLEAAYRAGKAPQSELIAAQSMQVELRNRATEAATQTKRARIALARYVGDAALRPLGDAPDFARLPDAARLADVDSQPELRLARAQASIAETETAIAREAKKPDWSAEVSYAYRGSPYSNMVSVMFSIDLPWSQGTRQDREHAARLKEEDAARAMLEDTQRMRLAEVQAMQAEWESAQGAGAAHRDRARPAGRSSAAMRRRPRIAAAPGRSRRSSTRGARCSTPSSASFNNSRPPRRRGPGSISSFQPRRDHEIHELHSARREARASCRCRRRCRDRERRRLLFRDAAGARRARSAGQRDERDSANGRADVRGGFERTQGSLLARSDGSGAEIRQARQESIHGHGPRTGLFRRGARRRRRDQRAAAAELRRAHRGRHRRNARHRILRGRRGRHRRALARCRAGAQSRLCRASARPCAVRRCRRGTAAGRALRPGMACGTGRAAGAQGQPAAGCREACRCREAPPLAARHAGRRNRTDRARRQAVCANHRDGAAGWRRVGDRRARRHGGHARHDVVQDRRPRKRLGDRRCSGVSGSAGPRGCAGRGARRGLSGPRFQGDRQRASAGSERANADGARANRARESRRRAEAGNVRHSGVRRRALLPPRCWYRAKR